MADNAATFLELEPQPHTVSGQDGEGRVLLYESSWSEEGQRLLTLRTFGRGLRLTTDQVRELHEWIGGWLSV